MQTGGNHKTTSDESVDGTQFSPPPPLNTTAPNVVAEAASSELTANTSSSLSLPSEAISPLSTTQMLPPSSPYNYGGDFGGENGGSFHEQQPTNLVLFDDGANFFDFDFDEAFSKQYGNDDNGNNDNNNDNGQDDGEDIEPEVQLAFEATEDHQEKVLDTMVLHHKEKSSKKDWIPMIGIIRDLKRRLPFYFNDLVQGIHPKSVVSVIFMFFCSIAPALTFGVHLQEITHGVFGVTEVLLSTALFGMIFAIFSGQPLVIVGVTGPVVIFITTVYDLALKFKLPFLQWYCIIGFWSSLMHILLAVFNLSNLVKYVTRFSDEVFAVLIGVIFIQEAIIALVQYFKHYSTEVALFCFIIAVGMFYIAYSLHYARSWDYFPKFVRRVLADLAVAISVGIFTGIVYIPRLRSVAIPFLEAPPGFKPTMDREWIVRYQSTGSVLPVWAYFAAILPAFVLTALFFFDHNVSSILSQRAEFKLKKGPAFHWDIFVIGAMMSLASLLGIPFVTGLLPQAPLHVISLASVKKIEDENGQKREVIVKVRENRITAFMQSLVIGIFAVFGQKVLRSIPHAVTTGLFLFMGATGFNGIQFADRVKLWIRDPSTYGNLPYSFLTQLPRFHIFVFTIIQGICWSVIYAITWTPVAIIFPVLILVLVPIRKFLLPRLFSKRHLYYLDNHETGQLRLYDASNEMNNQTANKVYPIDIIHQKVWKVLRPIRSAIVRTILYIRYTSNRMTRSAKFWRKQRPSTQVEMNDTSQAIDNQNNKIETASANQAQV